MIDTPANTEPTCDQQPAQPYETTWKTRKEMEEENLIRAIHARRKAEERKERQ